MLGLMAQPHASFAQDTQLKVTGEQIEGPSCAKILSWQDQASPAPCKAEELGQWLTDARRWRQERRIRIGFDDAEYRKPALAWTQSSFVQPQMMVQDRFFYDVDAGRYTVGRYLDDLDRRYGGIDSVLVWPTYPNMGIDDRNAYDWVSDMPEGIAGLRRAVEDFHARGVKVFFPVMLWDQGTRDEGVPDAEAIVKELKALNADGINGDTLDGISRNFREDSLALNHPLALEPEVGLASDEMLNWNTMSWGYWDYSFVPVVSRFKWIEPRHMVNISARFDHDHTDDLQHAFFNGVGFESWEDVWGIWNGLTPRDGEALRRMALIERFGKAFLVSQDWEPFTPMQRFGVFASKWPGRDGSLWTIVNRNHYAVNGRQLAVSHREGQRYYDLWSGVELHPSLRDSLDVLSFGLEPDGFGAVLASSVAPAGLSELMSKARQLNARPLSSFSHAWTASPQQAVAVSATPYPSSPPQGMVRIPVADFLFRVNGVEIEGGDDDGVDIQYPGESSPRRYHDLDMHVSTFWIDRTPVTNAEFKTFLVKTHYHPADDHNFLRDWTGETYPRGWDDKPVTWVSIEDARAYARWAGKRLPHEWEWQYAAQGLDGRPYPWGATMVSSNMPAPDNGRRMPPPSDVHAHPGGASPFGVLDLVGDVWQWTDEWRDAHTRAAVLRGGSHYRPAGSRWYFPQAYKLSEHGKYLLMSPGLDRSGAIGFRCVMDDEPASNPLASASK